MRESNSVNSVGLSIGRTQKRGLHHEGLEEVGVLPDPRIDECNGEFVDKLRSASKEDEEGLEDHQFSR